jgi:predicted RNA-binding Zn-ribbon protein involved in translation (DUF1610 family)
VEVAKFLKLMEDKLIHTFECPVCGEDLRKTFQASATDANKGNCILCKMGIQFNSYVTHHGHPGCEVRVQYPIAYADPVLRSRLRSEWVGVHGSELVSKSGRYVEARWVPIAQEIARKYNAERKPI